MSFISLYILIIFLFFFLIIPLLPKSTLFPYTTLFRSSGKTTSVSIELGNSTQSEDATPFFSRCFTIFSEIEMEEHTSELQSQFHVVCRLLLEKKKIVKHLEKKGVAPFSRKSRWKSTRL